MIAYDGKLSNKTWIELTDNLHLKIVGQVLQNCLIKDRLRQKYLKQIKIGRLRLYALVTDPTNLKTTVVVIAVLTDINAAAEMDVISLSCGNDAVLRQVCDFLNHKNLNLLDIDQRFQFHQIIKVNGKFVLFQDIKDGTVINHDLNLNNMHNLKHLPTIQVNGNLSLCKTQITHLPSGLVVNGNLDLRFTNKGIDKNISNINVSGEIFI